MNENIYSSVKYHIEQIDPHIKDDIAPEANIAFDLGFDSLDIIELVIRLERRFSVVIPDDTVVSIGRVKDLVKEIEELVSKKQDNENN